MTRRRQTREVYVRYNRFSIATVYLCLKKKTIKNRWRTTQNYTSVPQSERVVWFFSLVVYYWNVSYTCSLTRFYRVPSINAAGRLITLIRIKTRPLGKHARTLPQRPITVYCASDAYRSCDWGHSTNPFGRLRCDDGVRLRFVFTRIALC